MWCTSCAELSAGSLHVAKVIMCVECLKIPLVMVFNWAIRFDYILQSCNRQDICLSAQHLQFFFFFFLKFETPFSCPLPVQSECVLALTSCVCWIWVEPGMPSRLCCTSFKVRRSEGDPLCPEDGCSTHTWMETQKACVQQIDSQFRRIKREWWSKYKERYAAIQGLLSSMCE